MKNTNTNTVKPLSKLMERELLSFYNYQQLSPKPIPVFYSKGVKGLLMHGFLRLKQFTKDSRTRFFYYITEAGYRYLQELRSHQGTITNESYNNSNS